jgi:hypothetical protein
MSAVKPIFRELKQAAVKGFSHLHGKFHQVADNMHGHLDDVIKQVKGNDHFDAPGHGKPTVSKPANDKLIPRPECLNDKGEIDWSKAPKNGFVLDADGNPIKSDHTPQVGDRFDRYGDPRGTYVSPVPEDGPFSYESRSLPYEHNPNAYHQYEWTRTLDEAQGQYDQLSPQDREIVDSGLDYFGEDLSDLSPIQRGEAAPIPDWGTPGGATQDLLPISPQMLEILGLIREVK